MKNFRRAFLYNNSHHQISVSEITDNTPYYSTCILEYGEGEWGLERSVFLKNVEKPFLIIFIPFEKIYPGNI